MQHNDMTSSYLQYFSPNRQKQLRDSELHSDQMRGREQYSMEKLMILIDNGPRT